MTRCQDIRAGLDDWLDGLASPELRAEIDAHLAECAKCAGYFERQRRLAGDLAALGRAANRIADLEPAAARASASRWQGFWPAAAAAAIVVAGGVFLANYRTSHRAVQRADSEVTSVEQSPTTKAAPAFAVKTPEDCLAVPVESTNPRVHIVWLYKETLPVEPPAGEEPVKNPKPTN